MPLWHLMTITPHYHFLTLNCWKSLLEIVPSAWTPLWLIHHCVGDPDHLISEGIGTTKDLVLWKEVALELMWLLRGIITVLPHALIYLWVGPFRNLLNLLNLLLYVSTLNVWKRSAVFLSSNNYTLIKKKKLYPVACNKGIFIFYIRLNTLSFCYL